MRFVRTSEIHKTLRFRLMAWIAGLLLVSTISILLATNIGIYYLMLHELDAILNADASEIRLIVEENHPPSLRLQDHLTVKSESYSHLQWFAQLIENDRQIAASNDLPADLIANLGNQPIGMRTIDGFRVYQRTMRIDGRSVLLRVGMSLNPMAKDLSRITTAMVMVSLALVLFAPWGAYWLAGRFTGLLGEINETAQRLRPSELSERLPVRGVGDELDNLAETINRLLDRLAGYVEQRRDFLANAAHELRSPLASIKGAVELALASDRQTSEYVELLQNVAAQCDSLTGLVNQLLLLAEADSDVDIQCEPIPLDATCRKAVDLFGAIAETGGVTLTCRRLDPAMVKADPTHVRQLIYNLLDNAVKFTPTGGKVEVALRRDDTAQTVELTVTDTGPGIAAEHLPRIFDRFYRGDRTQLSRGGNGLGLSICQAVVTLYHGTIRIESEVGRGTCVRVSLPLATARP